MAKKISIITTFYNAEKFIEHTLTSIWQQVVDPKLFTLEYVIVDDMSPDSSREKVENFMRTHTLNGDWRLITPEQNLGCGGARRFGIEAATGDYFMFVDADDYYINRDFVLRAFNDITSEEADIVEYGIIFNHADGNKNYVTAPQKMVIENNPHHAEILLFRDNLIKFNVWTKIYKREIVESFRYSDLRTFEDVATIPVWIANAKKIVIMPNVEINYRAAAGSIIRGNMVDTRVGTISAIATHFERFKDDPELLKAMYVRSMIDIEALLNNHSSENEGFNEMSKLNTYMLKYIYPDTWQDKVFEVQEVSETADSEK